MAKNNMDNTLWVLGSAGWMPAHGNQTSCFLVELDGELIMLDAGTGTANLSLAANALSRHDHVSILLSHNLTWTHERRHEIECKATAHNMELAQDGLVLRL